MKAEIKLKLKIKDVEIDLTKSEVLELQGMLNGLFPAPVVIEKTVPYYVPNVPYVDPWHYHPPYHWTCDDSGVGLPYVPTITWCGQ